MTLARVWYMISMPSFCTLAKISFPSLSGTRFVISNARRSVQNLMQGSTSSTISTGVSCLSAGGGVPGGFVVASAIGAPLIDPSITKKRPACEADRSTQQYWLLRLHRIAAQGGIEAGTEDAADHAKDSKIHSGLHSDVSLGRVCRLEHYRATTARVSLYRRLFANARSHDVLVARILSRIHHYVIAVVDAAADHAVPLHLQKENIVGGNEPSVHGNETLPMLSNERRLAGVDLSIKRHRLRAKGRPKTEQVHTARSRGVSLDVSLSGKRLKQVRNRLRRLDLELLADVANARLVRVLGGEVEKVVVYRALELR